jgi:hypothetical protein
MPAKPSSSSSSAPPAFLLPLACSCSCLYVSPPGGRGAAHRVRSVLPGPALPWGGGCLGLTAPPRLRNPAYHHHPPTLPPITTHYHPLPPITTHYHPLPPITKKASITELSRAPCYRRKHPISAGRWWYVVWWWGALEARGGRPSRPRPSTAPTRRCCLIRRHMFGIPARIRPAHALEGFCVPSAFDGPCGTHSQGSSAPFHFCLLLYISCSGLQLRLSTRLRFCLSSHAMQPPIVSLA